MARTIAQICLLFPSAWLVREIGNLGAGTRFGGCGLEWFVDSLFAIIFERPTIIVQKSGGIEKLSVSVTLCG